jgi:uncharacterized protein (TIGR00369 family)
MGSGTARQETPADAETLAALTRMSEGFLPGLLGVRFTAVRDGFLEAELDITFRHMAPNGFLHAGTVVSLADTCCGVACARALPEGARGFTTVELKSNFLSSANEGTVYATARAVHLGRTTQLRGADVRRRGTEKLLALFRCTQMALWPR